jgi:hypothetical protein
VGLKTIQGHVTNLIVKLIQITFNKNGHQVFPTKT